MDSQPCVTVSLDQSARIALGHYEQTFLSSRKILAESVVASVLPAINEELKRLGSTKAAEPHLPLPSERVRR